MSRRQVTFLISANAKAFNKALNKAQYKLKAFGRKTERLGRSITGFATPFAIAGAASVKMASDFQASMTKIQTLVGLSRESVQGMRSDVLSLSKQTGRGPRELADALFAVTSAGLRGEKAMSTLERAAKASAIGLGDTKDVARALTGILQSYSKQGLSAADATDTLIGVVREGNLEASELAPVLGRVTGIASQLGISFSQVGASIASFTRLGVGAEEAVTGLRGIMNALLKQTPKSEKALASVGLTFDSLRGKIQKQGLAKALVDLTKRFKGNEKGLAAFAGRVRGLAAIMGTAGAQSESYLRIADSIADSTGNLDEGFKTVSKTLQFKFQKAFANLKVEATKLGTVLFPMAEKLINAISDWVKWFGELSDQTKENIFWWVKWGAIVGGSLIVIGKLSIALSGIIGLVSSLAGAIPGLIAGFEGLNVAALTASEEGLAAAITSLTAIEGLIATTGIGALVGAFYLVGKSAYDGFQKAKKLNGEVDKLINKKVDTQSWKDLEGRIGTITKKIRTLTKEANAFQLGDLVPGQKLKRQGQLGAGIVQLLAKRQKLKEKLSAQLKKNDPVYVLKNPGGTSNKVNDFLSNLIPDTTKPMIYRPKVKVEPDIQTSGGGDKTVLTDLQKKVKSILSGVQADLDAFAKKARFPEIFGDTAGGRLNALKRAMNDLIMAGISPTSAAFTKLKGIYDTFKTDIGQASLDLSFDIDTTGLDQMVAKTKDLRTATEIALGKTHQAYSDFSKKLSSEVVPVIVDGLFNIGTAFLENAVAALTAGSAFKDAGLQLLKGLADLAIKAGSIILAAGIGIESLRDSLISFTGIGAIVAGGALIAIGAAAKGALKAAGSSAATGVSSSGGSLSGTTSPSLSNTDSTRVFLSNISNNSQSAFQSAMERALSNARWKVSGGDLQMVLNNSSNSYR